MKLHPALYAAVMVACLMAALVVALLSFAALVNAVVGGVVVVDLLVLGYLAGVGADRADDWIQHSSYSHARGHTVRG